MRWVMASKMSSSDASTPIPGEDDIDCQALSLKLANDVDLITQLLDDLLRGCLIKPCLKEYEKKLKFIIARKWNSWYPCYFNTEGGCYAFITRDSESEPTKNSGVMVIDPGIKFIDNLRDLYNIEPHDIRTVVTSHYHPDHTMGLFELLTLTHETRYSCSYYLNKTTYDTFKQFQGKYSKIAEMTKDQIVKLADYHYLSEKKKVREIIYMKTIKTFHEEVGNRHNCLGFEFNIVTQNKKDRQIVLLGDTDGNDKYFGRYLNYLKEADAIVLHAGSYSDKDKGFGKGNKHLYKCGILNIINCINCKRGGKIPIKEGKLRDCLNKGIIAEVPDGGVTLLKSCPIHSDTYFNNLQLVIISELGLEMATISEFLNSVKNFKWFKDLYPLLLISKLSNEKDSYKNYFHKETRNVDKDLDEKLITLLELFSTISLESINKLVDHETGKNEKLHIYNFSILFSIFIWYSSFSQITPAVWKKSFLPHPAHEKLIAIITSKEDELKRISDPIMEEKLRNDIKKAREDLITMDLNAEEEYKKAETAEKTNIILQTKLGTIDTRDFLESRKTYEHFLENFGERVNTGDISDYVTAFQKVLYSYLDKLIDHACLKYSNIDVLKCLKLLSENLFFGIKSVKDFDGVLKTSSLQEFVLFARSISLFGKDNKKLLKYIQDRHSYEYNMFTTSIYLLSYELAKYAESHAEVKNDKECLGLGEDLLRLLSEYNTSDIKFFIGNIGLEIDLSEKRLGIRSSPKKEFIDVAIAEQDINDGIQKRS